MTEQNFPPEWAPHQTFADNRIGLSLTDGIAVLAIQIPEKMNALDDEALTGIVDALEVARSVARVLIFTGVGGKAFISGANIGKLEDGGAPRKSFMERHRPLAEFPVPTMAVIRGYCLGGGVMSALNCDFRLAGTDAKFSVPAAKLGLSVGREGLGKIVEAVGPARARMILYSGDRIDAQTAFDWGLVDQLHAPDTLWSEAMALARRIASNAPLSVRATKLTVDDLLRVPSEQRPEEIEDLARQCRASADFAEGRAAFRDKRVPVFEGR